MDLGCRRVAVHLIGHSKALLSRPFWSFAPFLATQQELTHSSRADMWLLC
jgi:hypothetical protein